MLKLIAVLALLTALITVPMSSAAQDNPAPARVIRISSGVAQSQRISSVPPVYPPMAKAAHVQGTVVMLMKIDDEGKPTSLQVISGPEMLTSAAMEAVRQWRYRPYLLNGEPVAVETQVVVNFNLSS